ncbi:MAG: RluA family pseudouridine synthase [Myxococcota bacterium]
MTGKWLAVCSPEVRRDATVGPGEDGRLDRWLADRTGVGRKRAQAKIAAGEVWVDGRRGPKSTTVIEGQRVEWTAFDDLRAVADPRVELSVVHQDGSLVIVDKPAFMSCHPLRAGETGTLANGLLAAFPDMANVGYSAREPGLVHRLDTETSGLVLCARTQEAHRQLRNALLRGEIEKTYLALVAGVPEDQRLEGWLYSDPHHRARVFVSPTPVGRARQAVTRVSVMNPGRAHTLVRASAPVAGRHQIRAQLAAAGHPLAGDRLYGGASLPDLHRHFLHAETLSLIHPANGGRLELESPLPEDLRAVCLHVGIEP